MGPVTGVTDMGWGKTDHARHRATTGGQDMTQCHSDRPRAECLQAQEDHYAYQKGN